MRTTRITIVLAMLVIASTAVFAAPAGVSRASRFDRTVQLVRGIIARVQSRITVPVGRGGSEDPAGLTAIGTGRTDTTRR